MSTTFPTTKDTYVNPTPNSPRDNPSLAGQITDKNDAILALETKVGVNSSTDHNSHDYKLSGVISSDKAVSLTGSEALTNKNLTAGTNTFPTLNQDTTGVAGGLKSATTSVIVSAASAPSAGQILTAVDNHTAIWQAPAVTGQVIEETLNASMTLAAGQPVGVNEAGQAASAFRMYDTLSMTPSGSVNGYSLDHTVQINTDKIVQLNYTNNNLYATIGTITETNKTLALGTPVLVTSSVNTSFFVSVSKLDADKFIVFYVNNASAVIVKYRIGTVSGTVITFGSETTAYTSSSNIFGLSSDFISTNKGVLAVNTAGNDGVAVVFTASGTVGTFGTPLTLSTHVKAASNNIQVRTTNTDKFMVVTYNGYCQVCTCAGGTTITGGAEVQFTTTITNSLGSEFLIVPTTDTVVILINEDNTNIKSDLVCGTISGTTPSFGTILTNISYGAYGIVVNSSSSFVFFGRIAGEAYFSKLYTISGNTLTDAGYLVYGFGAQTPTYPISLGSLYISFTWSMNVLYYYISGMSNNFIGIAQSAVTVGQAVNVLVRGLDVNQTGLITGGTYNIVSGVLTPVNSSESPIIANKLIPIGKALSATSILI